MARSAWLLGSVVVGTALLAPPGMSVMLGAGPALAAPAKKAGGRVRVEFQPTSAAKGTKAKPVAAPVAAASKAKPAATPVAAAAAKPAKPAKVAAKVAAKPQAQVKSGEVKTTGRRAKITTRKVVAKARYSSLPKYQPRVVLRPAAASGVAEAKSAPLVPTPAPPPALQVPAAPNAQAPAVASRPAEAPAATTALPPDRVMSTASIAPAPVVLPAAERMRSALEARARTMASQMGHIAVPQPDAPPPVQLQARSVTFDFQKGVRTVVFEDGATVTAPFDKGKAENLTGLPAAR